ncbi:MAG TPA: serine hydrolase [Xanthobacteraceae bacterium]|jgi:D-alanyl-D-alanine carboxypeptidase
MPRILARALRGLRSRLFGCAAIAAALAGSGCGVQAAPYADIVVDGNAGNVLHATNSDALRHPASLTKIMTLYLLFEQLEAGRFKLDSLLRISEEAASQSPTKLGLRAGTTIAVEDAIKGIVTRSANDAAVVIAEAIAGSEKEFAKLMTQKAQALGMSRTLYKNASGLPDDMQVTTARDQSILGRAIQERFPRYYKYFSTRSFTFRGQSIGNHNHLLGRVEGVDGIKTGYTHASGFNLVTSLHRGNRYLVAVVMGGNSAGSRDARMRELITTKLAQASARRSAPATAELADGKVEARTAADPKHPVPDASPQARGGRQLAAAKPSFPSTPQADAAKPRFALASAGSVPVRLDGPAAARGQSATTGTHDAAVQTHAGSSTSSEPAEPIRPVLVRTVTVRAPGASGSSSFAALRIAAVEPVGVGAPVAPEPVGPAKSRPQAATLPVVPPAPAAAHKAEAQAAASAPPVGAQPESPTAGKIEPAATENSAGSLTANSSARSPAVEAPTSALSPMAKRAIRSGWMIQVGAYPAEHEAQHRLSMVQNKASKMLGGADPFTETVEKGGTTYYRARFAGLDKEKAEAACRFLKRNDVDCVAIKN